MLDDPDLLEMQFDETPVFDTLQSELLPMARRGCVTLPSVAGIGLSLDADVLRSGDVTVFAEPNTPTRNEERTS